MPMMARPTMTVAMLCDAAEMAAPAMKSTRLTRRILLRSKQSTTLRESDWEAKKASEKDSPSQGSSAMFPKAS